MTLAAGTTIIGMKIPGVNGRRIIVTFVAGNVDAGQFQDPAGTIDIYACYRFSGPGFEVGPPHVFSRAIAGSFVNAVDGSIDLAVVRYNAASNTACALTPSDPGFFLEGVGPGAIPPIPFFHSLTSPLANVAAVDIGTVTRLVLHNNGDGIVLPGSAEATVTSPASVPLGASWGLAILAVAILGAGVGMSRRLLRSGGKG